MSLFKKYLVVTAIPIINSLCSSNLYAANIYVDKNLSADITDGTYSIATRDNNGADGKAFTTIQAAVNAMNGGDDIYIREGTYLENVSIPQSKNGSNSDWSSIQSYPGEWAVLDGQNKAGCTLGLDNTGSLGDNDIKYWQVEHLEITGGTNGADGGGGFCGNGGPFVIRYNYFHDNIATSNGENPGGIRGYTWHDSLVEFNWFRNNGSTQKGDNGGDISIFGDYRYKSPGVKFNTGAYEGYYRARNEYRYNYFESGVNGIRQKSVQDMVDGDFTLPNIYQSWGEKIHHNFFGNYSYTAVQVWGDFTQVYNNISRSSIESGSYTSGAGAKIVHTAFYNNTLIGSRIVYNAGEADTSLHPYITTYSNIIDKFPDNWYDLGIDIGAHSGAWDDGAAANDLSDADVNYNYMYRPIKSDHFLVSGSASNPSPLGYLSTSEFNSVYGKSNYTKASSEGSDNLFVGASGASQYIARGAHVLGGAKTIANGGFGGPHPYLSGITLPSYVGAVDPNNSGWVANLLCLKDINVLKNGGKDGPVCGKAPKAIEIFYEKK